MNKKKFVKGLRDGLPIGLGYLTVSFGIGIACHNVGLNAFQGFLMSFLNNASAGECRWNNSNSRRCWNDNNHTHDVYY